MAKSNTNKRRLRRSMKKGGSSHGYANAVYGVPQVAASNHDNTITMNQVRGGSALVTLSPSAISGGGNNSKRGGRVGLEELLVPAGLLVANQWMSKGKSASFKNKSSKSRRQTYRRRR